MLGYSLYVFFMGNEVSQRGLLFSCCYLLLGKPYAWVFASRLLAAAGIHATQSETAFD